MAYRNVGRLRSHLSMFKPTYPIQKGYVAWLLLDHTIQQVMRAVKDIVKTAEPEKIVNENSLTAHLSRFKKLLKCKKNNLTREWQSLIKLFLEHFPITFRSFHTPPAPSTHVLPIKSSSTVSKFPEVTCTLISETPDQINTLHTPTQMHTLQACVAPDSASCGLSPKKLKGQCASCVCKQQTNLLMMQENKNLQNKLRELRKTMRADCSMKRFNEKMRRKEHAIRIWKCRYTVVKKVCKNTEKLKMSLNVSQQTMEILKRCVDELEEEKKKLNVMIEQQNRTLKKLEEDNASLKLKYEKLQRESKSVKKVMHISVKNLKNTAAQIMR